MKILLTGGAGFIGSHTLIELTEAGHEAVVVDNLDNSSPISLKRVAKIIGKEVPFYKVDIRDREGMQKVFDEHKFDACIHFAGLKAVGESCVKPLEYYENNMNGTFVLVDVMRKNGCKNMIFFSSATVYGDPAIIPITERIIKPGINAEKERDTEAGTLSGNLMTQLRRTIKVNISATTRPIIIPEMIFAPPNQFAPTA